MSLNFYCNFQTVRSKVNINTHESRDPSHLASVALADVGGVMMLRLFSWHTLDPLVPTGHHLIITAYLGIVADHVQPTFSRITHHVTKVK